MVVTTRSIRLGYESYKVDLSESDSPKVFGELLKLASGIVKAYGSDLFHDAVWLYRNVPGTPGVAFYYGVRESGTSLSRDLGDVAPFNASVWRVTVRVIDGSTVMDIDTLSVPA